MWLSLLRSLLITDPLIILFTIVMGSISALASLFDSDGRLQHKVACAWARLLLRVSRVKVKVIGLERIEPGRSYVFVANHASYMDTPVVMAHLPVEFRFLAKQGLFFIPMLGWHLKRAGHLPVVRGDPRASLHSMTEAARIIRDRGISVLLFPEGGRTQDGQVQEFKEGAAFIAIKAGVPVVPVGLRGTREVLPFGSGHIRPGAVEVLIADPIETSVLKPKDRAGLTHMLRERVMDLLGETAAQTNARR
jgi:1-acyl-sn-glycerol-3-phosphate acyltransferase